MVELLNLVKFAEGSDVDIYSGIRQGMVLRGKEEKEL